VKTVSDPSGNVRVVVRSLLAEDVDAAAEVWHESRQVAYSYLSQQPLSLEADKRIFREHIWPNNDLWVATVDERVVGLLGMKGSYVGRLYIHPKHQRLGIGTALLEQARRLSPAGLELHTHQKNVQAREFYEHHGFRAVHFGISPAPENEPDVEYHWRPQ
jgi:GNAT superfamily N-acetyltransferase